MTKIIEKKQVCSCSFVFLLDDADGAFCSLSKQMQDFMKLYSGLVERCFTSCCNDFTSKALSSKEVCLLPFPYPTPGKTDRRPYRTHVCKIVQTSF
jgi:hypothetical protein